jgi:uncharacterized protein YndB with AHSA1/START domain
MVHSVEIDRSREDVFAYATDPTRFREWQEAVVRASRQGSGPLQQGSRSSLTRRMGKREQTMTSELTEYSPPESYAFRVVDGPVRALGKGRFDALGDARTRFTPSSSTSRATGSASCSSRSSSAGRRRRSFRRATRT